MIGTMVVVAGMTYIGYRVGKRRASGDSFAKIAGDSIRGVGNAIGKVREGVVGAYRDALGKNSKEDPITPEVVDG
jgi:hypothetical protein